MAIEFNGLEELSAALRDKAELSVLKMVVKEHGSRLQSEMMRQANFTQGYQTGTTKRSIKLKIEDNGLTARVKPGTEYSPYLEYGTRKMTAQPFVRPALESVKEGFKADLERLVR